MANSAQRLGGLDLLRGLASLAVCWFHLTRFSYPTCDGPIYAWLRRSGVHGWLGVEVFFVISGFVIPYSLHRGGYRLVSYARFLLKRIVRLDPPYLVSIAVILVLAAAHAWRSGGAVEVEGAEVSTMQVLLHLGYLNAFFGYVGLNPGFWTLAIELQYYLALGLLFPLVVSRRRVARLTCFAAISGVALLADHGVPIGGQAPYGNFVARFVFLFLLGILTCQRRLGLIGWMEHRALFAAALLGCLATVGGPATLAGALAALVIPRFAAGESLLGGFFGRISYSLYLLHWPLGHWTLSVLGLKLLRAESDLARMFVLLVALAVCLVCAQLLYVWIERPSQRWAARIRYAGATRQEAPGEVSGCAPATPPPSAIC